MRAGATMPMLGFGTWRLAGEACRRAVRDALALGYRHLDTAQGYHNEAEVGQAMREANVPRDAIYLTTKVWPDDLVANPAIVDESLERLQTNYLDLLLLHWPSPTLSIDAAVEALEAVRRSGKTHAIGVSNYTIDQCRRAAAIAPIMCNQVELHPFLNQRSLRAACQTLNLRVVAYCPIARGQVNDDPVLRDIARAHQLTPAQVSLCWLRQQGIVAIPKAASPSRQRENLASLEGHLSEEAMKRINGLSCNRRLVDPDFAPRWDSPDP